MSRQNGQGRGGFSTLEALVAVGILAVAIVSGGFQVNSAMTTVNKMRRDQTVDGLEFSLYTLLSRDDVVTASVQRSGNTALTNCLNNNGCQNAKYSNIAMYVPGTAQAITGKGIYYDKAGQSWTRSPCSGKSSCKEVFYQILTTVTTHCASSTSCTSPSGVTVGFSIVDAKGDTLTVGEVDRVLASGSLITAMNIGCPTGAIMQGIGLDGAPLCVSKNKVEFADEKPSSLSAHDCRKEKKDPKSPNDSNPKDQYFIQSLKSGGATCAQSFWNE